MEVNADVNTSRATLGGGCFWCLEAIFKRISGVAAVVSGYAGGKTKNPTYEKVCSGRTGHAEVVQIEYDPSIINYAQILDIFWQAHDPTSLNRQGADIGSQYRSIILYHDQLQKEGAEESKRAQDESGKYSRQLVTEIIPLTHFYPAEDYHQDYYANNLSERYCTLVIQPKLRKLEFLFP